MFGSLFQPPKIRKSKLNKHFFTTKKKLQISNSTTPQRFCIHCGAPHVVAAKFCGECGERCGTLTSLRGYDFWGAEMSLY